MSIPGTSSLPPGNSDASKTAELTAAEEEALKKEARKKELLKSAKKLIAPGIKYFFAAKLNGFTGEKFKCLRNWEESSSRALLQAVNDKLSLVVNKLLLEKKSRVLEKLKEKLYAKTGTGIVSECVRDVSGLNQVFKICEDFFTVSCDLLMQTEEGAPPQTINRLLTITGVLYKENVDVRKIIGSLSQHFFTERLPAVLKALKEKHGKLGGLAEKFVTILGVKGLVDRFLKTCVFENSKFSAEEIKNKGDVYEKLILKGVSKFVDIKGSDELDLDTILKSRKLAPEIKTQIKAFKDSYSKSGLLKVGQLAVGSEKIFMQTFLSKIKDKDITKLFKKSEDNKDNKDNEDSLEGILIDTIEECLLMQAQSAVSAAETGLVNLGRVLVSGVEIVHEGISKLWNTFLGSNDNKIGEQNPVPKAQREVKTEERTVPKRFETSKKEEDLLEACDEFVTKSLNEGQTVEQKPEESTGILTVFCNAGNAVWKGAKAVTGWVWCGLNWARGAFPREESKKRIVQEGQVSEYEVEIAAKPGVQPQPVQKPQPKDVSVGRGFDTSEPGVVQTVKDAQQSVAQTQVSSDQQVLDVKAVDDVIVERKELEADAESNVISDDVKAGVSVVDQSNSKLDSNVAQQTASQMDPKSSVIQSGATVTTTEMNQKTDSESRTESQGNVAQGIDEGDGVMDKIAYGVGTGIGTVLRWGIDGLRWLTGTGDHPAHEPAVTVASSEPDAQKKAESSDSSEQKVEESGKKDVEIQTTTATAEKTKETQKRKFNVLDPFTWFS